VDCLRTVELRVVLNTVTKLHERREDVLSMSVATCSATGSVSSTKHTLGPIGVGQSEASRRLGCDPASRASAGTALK
jgi:hypothetical protein